jgi:hypothetical protein
MIEQLCALPPIATALDAIIERFGVDQVAEVTGRTRRLIIVGATVVRNSNPGRRAPTSPKPRPSWTAPSASWSFPTLGNGAQLPCRSGREEPGPPRPLPARAGLAG